MKEDFINNQIPEDANAEMTQMLGSTETPRYSTLHQQVPEAPSNEALKKAKDEKLDEIEVEIRALRQYILAKDDIDKLQTQIDELLMSRTPSNNIVSSKIDLFNLYKHIIAAAEAGGAPREILLHAKAKLATLETTHHNVSQLFKKGTEEQN